MGVGIWLHQFGVENQQNATSAESVEVCGDFGAESHQRKLFVAIWSEWFHGYFGFFRVLGTRGLLSLVELLNFVDVILNQVRNFENDKLFAIFGGDNRRFIYQYPNCKEPIDLILHLLLIPHIFPINPFNFYKFSGSNFGFNFIFRQNSGLCSQ